LQRNPEIENCVKLAKVKAVLFDYTFGVLVLLIVPLLVLAWLVRVRYLERKLAGRQRPGPAPRQRDALAAGHCSIPRSGRSRTGRSRQAIPTPRTSSH
jgi:hypothetical protein